MIDLFERVLDNIEAVDGFIDDQPYQPIALLLLDIHMPMVSGFEVIKAVKKLYHDLNERFSSDDTGIRNKIVRPLICFYS